jgi:dUTP pyrophosphatase
MMKVERVKPGIVARRCVDCGAMGDLNSVCIEGLWDAVSFVICDDCLQYLYDAIGEQIQDKGDRFVNVVLGEKAKLPSRAHSADAGMDLFAPEPFVVRAHGSAIVDTHVHMEIPVGYVGFLKSKSGLNVKYGITSEGVIDAGYTGSIVVKLYNHSDGDYYFDAGDKISQIVLVRIGLQQPVCVDGLSDTERGGAGFGSTGRR